MSEDENNGQSCLNITISQDPGEREIVKSSTAQMQMRHNQMDLGIHEKQLSVPMNN